MDDYRLIADVLAADIAAGRLRPGERLAPQRQFARRRGIATSTAARVYGELVRRGLAVGEVGRGTFVRAAEPVADAGPTGERVNLELNYPVLPEQAALVADSLAGLLDPDRLAGLLGPPEVTGTAAARAAADVLARVDWRPAPDRILFAGNGKQAIAAAVAALVGVGGRLGVESYTYPVIKSIAARLGVTLVPLATDDDGALPDAVRVAHRATPLRAVYLQPAVHNPLGMTMPPARRVELAGVLDELDLPLVEDTCYGFLRPDVAPLAALAPGRTVLVDSLSKRLASGLSIGFIVPPMGSREPIAAAARSSGWLPQRVMLAAAARCMSDGTVAAIQHAKRADAVARQDLVRAKLGGFAVRADPASYHCWWSLPAPWRAETFVAAAGRLGIAVTPGASFTVGGGHAPNAVRLALGAPTVSRLADALDTLARLAASRPDDTGVE